jgi:hypothetical protein
MLVSSIAELVQYYKEIEETFNVFFSPNNWERDEIARSIGCYHEDVTHQVITVSERGDIVQQFGLLDEIGTTVEIGCSDYLHRSKSYAVLHNLNRSEIGEATKLLAILVNHLDTPFLNNPLMEYNGVGFPEEIPTIQFFSVEMLKAFLEEYQLYEEYGVDPSDFSGYFSDDEGLEDTTSYMESYYSETANASQVVDRADNDWGESFDPDPFDGFSKSEIDEMYEPYVEFAEYGDHDDDESYGGFAPNRYAKRKAH